MDTNERLAQWLTDKYGVEMRVREQNMNKNSRAARALKERGLPADTVRWAWAKDGGWPIKYFGVFIKRDSGISIDDLGIGKDRYPETVVGAQYVFHGRAFPGGA